ncbi:hypothetical protein JI664_07315 [Rhodobacter sp. NTK016B]|uniref:hypothetical protein n=1 Tax=Rhodobacter sp. NTK016B TaxID=2759676 RepID=UPI001A8F1640|nr:hypothetical protein [Rhodobacter sp. NTK016B]MBN8291768.1 hypothetical protein [Rhodobacter sp. NTK016B]
MRISAEVDELAMVRSRIARLRAREAELCATLIAGDAAARRGRWTIAHLREIRVRVFDHRLLPLDLQADGTFWQEQTKIVVDVSLRDGLAPGATDMRADDRQLASQNALVPAIPDLADAALIAMSQEVDAAWT